MKTTKFFKTLYIVTLLMILIFSCKKNNEDIPDNKVTKFQDLVVDQDFLFNSTQKITVQLNYVPSHSGELPHIFKIYEGSPAAGGKLLCSGMSDEYYQYTAILTLPTRVEKIFVENNNAEGIFELVSIEINQPEISYTFYNLSSGKADGLKTVITDPGCNEGCTESLSGTYNNLTVNSGDHFCLPEGENVTINNLKMKGGTIVICGNLTANNITVQGNSGGYIYISEPGTLTYNNLNTNKLDLFYNFGIVSSSNNLTVHNDCDFINIGTMNVVGITINAGGHLQNTGLINASGHLNNNSHLTNEGTINIAGHFNNNGNGLIDNWCKIVVSGHFNQNDDLNNYSYIQVTGTTHFNGTSVFSDGALLQTVDLIITDDLIGPGTGCAKIDISGTTNISGGSSITGNMDICDVDGIENNNGSIGPSVTYCECYIPQTACGPESGTPSSDDTDGDGVPDVNDDYPNDPERAFDNYYPNETEFGTFSYEDLWPGMGDYDFNDLVLDFHYHIVTNAQNLIVDIITKCHVDAVGASLNNGFGISIPINPNRVGDITGFVQVTGNINLNAKGYENGHNNHTVIIFYDAINTIYNASIFNTVPGGLTIVTDTITVTAYFSNPQIALGFEPYNPFIYINQERGKEVHLKNNPPTDLVNSSYFGTFNDDSNPSEGRYYTTENGLPWAIETPVSFDYPIEKADILTAYLKFVTWAQSAGQDYTNWYLDMPEYRNDANIYATYQ